MNRILDKKDLCPGLAVLVIVDVQPARVEQVDGEVQVRLTNGELKTLDLKATPVFLDPADPITVMWQKLSQASAAPRPPAPLPPPAPPQAPLPPPAPRPPAPPPPRPMDTIPPPASGPTATGTAGAEPPFTFTILDPQTAPPQPQAGGGANSGSKGAPPKKKTKKKKNKKR